VLFYHCNLFLQGAVMNLGANLVIKGTILGSLILALMSYSFVGRASFGSGFASTALTAMEIVSSAGSPSPSGVTNASDAEGGKSDRASIRGSANCQISAKFPDNIQQWCEMISTYASEVGAPADLVASMIWQESGGDPNAYSHSGAVGLMQVMPRDGIAANFICPNGPCFSSRPTIAELQDPKFNIEYGTKMLANLFNKYGSYREALRAYGPKDVGYYYADKILALYENYGR
jgi:hypothetical protein